MTRDELLSAIQSEAVTLATTKAAFKVKLQERGLTVTDVFRDYAGLINSLVGAEVTVLDEKTVSFRGKTIEVVPSEGYDAIAKVIIRGDPMLVPHNIAAGKAIFGVTGTTPVAERGN